MKILKNIKHIVFDCDGTLVSSMDFFYKEIHQLLKAHLSREISHDEFAKNIHPVFPMMFQNFGIHDPAQINDLLEKIKNLEDHPNDFECFDGIKELLEKLNPNYELYIWTMRDRLSTERILKTHQLRHFFNDMRCGDDQYVKPDGKALTQMLGPIDSTQVLMIGDTPFDILGGKSFGCKTVGAIWCATSVEELLVKNGADVIASHPLDLLNN